jgi:predicted dehydrogenase
MPSLRFAVVGCGTIAPTHVDAITALGSDVAILTHCCDIDEALGQQFAAKYDLTHTSFAEILASPEIDAVSICTPSGLHARLGSAALAAGKHVITEKPMDISLAACDLLRGAAAKSGRTLSVICQHRFDPASEKARILIDSGQLGKIVLIDTQICWYRSQDYYDSAGWRGTWQMDGGGCLMNQGVHTVDLMRWLGGAVDTVYAQTRTAAHERIDVEDAVSATLTFKNGAIGTITASTAAYPGFPARLAIYGSEGSLVIEGDALQTLAIQGQEIIQTSGAHESAVRVASGGTRSVVPGLAVPATGSTTSENGAPAWGDAHLAQFKDFVRCCQTGDQPLVDGAGARAAVAVVLAVYESARTGQVIQMDSFEAASEASL